MRRRLSGIFAAFAGLFRVRRLFKGALERMLPGKPDTRDRIVRIGSVAGALAIGGFLVAVSGIIPIKASSGHWGITEAFLQFAKRRSVATHSIGTKVPPLDDMALIIKGAGHYDLGCRPCHSVPFVMMPHIPDAMTPDPPRLEETVPRWKDQELFHIVKHGIKLTGMPSWPSLERDDEVWAVVAFLRKLPGIKDTEYNDLVSGPHEGGISVGGSGHAHQGDEAPYTSESTNPPVRELEGVEGGLLETCRRCHGIEGHGRGFGAFPRLAGQSAEYMYQALQAYAQGDRHSGIMKPIAGGLSREEMVQLARYYAGLPKSAGTSASPERVERGRLIAMRGTRQIPACSQCHGPSERPRNPAYPELAGQYPEYLVLQLELFKSGKRGGSVYGHLMQEVAPHLSEEDVRDVAVFYASQ